MMAAVTTVLELAGASICLKELLGMVEGEPLWVVTEEGPIFQRERKQGRLHRLMVELRL